jgi:hypothetical protein
VITGCTIGGSQAIRRSARWAIQIAGITYGFPAQGGFATGISEAHPINEIVIVARICTSVIGIVIVEHGKLL